MLDLCPDHHDGASWYAFSGAVVAAHLPGVALGDVFRGTFCYDPAALPADVPSPEACYPDPSGWLDATIGACRVRSAGPTEISVFASPEVSRVTLDATPGSVAGAQIHACRLMLLARHRIATAAALAAALDADAFDTRSFTLEDASYTGFAIGQIRALARLYRHAA